MQRPGSFHGLDVLAACLLLALAGCGGQAGPAGAGTVPSAAPTASTGQGAPAASPSTATAGSPASPPTETAKVKVGVSNLVGEAALYIALDKGYFQEQGLDVELVHFNQTADEIPALMTGEVDLSASAVGPGVFNAAERSIPIKVVSYLAVVTPRSATGGLVVRQDHVDSGRYREPQDLKGMLVAVSSPPGAASDYFLERFAQRAGITFQDMETTTVPFPQMAAALANKAVDAAYDVEPFITVAEQQGTGKFVVPNGQFLPGVPVFVLKISPVFARAQPQVADRFMVAFLKGQRFNYEAITSGQGKDEVYATLQNHTPIKDTAMLARMLTDAVAPDGVMDTAPLAEIQDAFIRYGTVQQKLDMSQLVDPSYAARAVQQLGW
jgi:NitT/TauT family transport system substrate-binding protein